MSFNSMPLITLRLDNDDDWEASITDPSVDYTAGTITATVNKSLPSANGVGELVFTPNVTIIENIVGSIIVSVEFLRTNIALLKGSEILTLTFNNGTKQITARYRLATCL